MKYRAIAEWSNDGWWAVHVAGHPGVWTQARRLEQIPDAAADALSMALEIDVSAGDIEVDATPPTTAVSRAREMRDVAEAASIKASSAMRVAVRDLIRVGMTVRDVGAMLGVSHQRAAVLAREVADDQQVPQQRRRVAQIRGSHGSSGRFLTPAAAARRAPSSKR